MACKMTVSLFAVLGAELDEDRLVVERRGEERTIEGILVVTVQPLVVESINKMQLLLARLQKRRHTSDGEVGPPA